MPKRLGTSIKRSGRIVTVATCFFTASWAGAQNTRQFEQFGQYGAQYGAKVSDRAPPRCVADGYCQPKRVTWGYYQGNWRRWPIRFGEAGPGAAGPIPRELKPFDAPSPEQEDRRTPTPVSDLIPTPTPVTPNVEKPAPDLSSIRKPQTRPPEPATVQMPTMPPPPPRANPFDVQPSSLEKAVASTDSDPTSDRQQPAPVHRQDPPPPLPKKLWSYGQANRSSLSSQLFAPLETEPARPKLARLPLPSRKSDDAVKQAAAVQPAPPEQAALGVVTANGTNASSQSRVLPAVYWEPIPQPSTTAP